MLRCFAIERGRLRPLEQSSGTLPDEAVWIDLATPTEAEERLVERSLGIEIPTRAEAGGIQASDRLVYADGTLYTSALVPATSHSSPPTIPLTFVRDRREADHRALQCRRCARPLHRSLCARTKPT